MTKSLLFSLVLAKHSVVNFHMFIFFTVKSFYKELSNWDWQYVWRLRKKSECILGSYRSHQRRKKKCFKKMENDTSLDSFPPPGMDISIHFLSFLFWWLPLVTMSLKREVKSLYRITSIQWNYRGRNHWSPEQV